MLAGQVYQDNVVTPTRAANIFYARGTVFVEAGGALMANPQAWTALVTKLQPGRLKSHGRSGQAPRGVLLCFDLETFTRPGAAEAIANAARYLQARLGEISQILGISFPVYVLFTRADRLPFFAEFVRNLNQRRSGPGGGCDAAHALDARGGRVCGEETQRLTGAFNQLFHSFCDHRLLLLPREGRRREVAAGLRISARVPQAAQHAGAVPGGYRAAQPVSRQSVSARILFLRRAAGGRDARLRPARRRRDPGRSRPNSAARRACSAPDSRPSRRRRAGAWRRAVGGRDKRFRSGCSWGICSTT